MKNPNMMMTPTRPSIVIVEDADEDFDTVLEAVKRAGVAIEVRRATSGGECLVVMRELNPVCPVLVLMDLNTPGIDGREALRLIKGDPALKSLPVVVLSTSDNPRDVDFCYTAGANAYPAKLIRYPDYLQMLIDLLRYWIVQVALPVRGGSSA